MWDSPRVSSVGRSIVRAWCIWKWLGTSWSVGCVGKARNGEVAALVFCLHCSDPFRSHGDPPEKCPWCEQPTCWLTKWDLDFLRVNRIRTTDAPLFGTVES